jgi:hypothetical protein
MVDKPKVARSHRAVLSWQLAGIVDALRSTIPYGMVPGKATIALLAALRKQMEAPGDQGLGIVGVGIDNIPHLDDQSSPADVMVVAEALYGLIQCLLAPDEREEQQNFFGFRPPQR